jgi:hypothetical protein
MADIVRSIDENGDWNFGNGINDYKVNQDAVGQNIKTRILEWKNNCFFNNNAGIDWKNRLEKNQQVLLEQEIKSTILRTQGVVSLTLLQINLVGRNFTVNYQVITIYSRQAQQALQDTIQGVF